MTNVHTARREDRSAILDIAAESGLFAPEELPDFMAAFDDWSPDGAEEARVWLIVPGGAGAALLAPEPMSDNVWNMLFVGVREDDRRRGVGRALLRAVEDRARDDGGRLLLIDTSGDEAQSGARVFYGAMGYAEEAVIRDYYGEGIDRVTFRRRL
ncbi:GNAT family N-acetyltransferase [Jannaschia sp. S6380]|uniref:GNAT family N-acetyltransferase n=1 Tax=Jannaschia sp. S6380 TaxID=2926408 RepID=UPI001FF630B3|nr:GNAT family N-acetyltransferase [Jannaschia sp. S6380]MCK0168006.1 GNAT family N-acetyltransferase [Jannaschia sp. S6380]